MEHLQSNVLPTWLFCIANEEWGTWLFEKRELLSVLPSLRREYQTSLMVFATLVTLYTQWRMNHCPSHSFRSDAPHNYELPASKHAVPNRAAHKLPEFKQLHQ